MVPCERGLNTEGAAFVNLKVHVGPLAPDEKND